MTGSPRAKRSPRSGGGAPEPGANYTAAMVDFSQPAATGIPSSRKENSAYGPLDIDALVTYMGALPNRSA